MRRTRRAAGAAFGLAALLITGAPAGVAAADFIRGADLSSVPQVESAGGVFSEDGGPRDILDILRDHGFNFARLRLWHAPVDGACGLQPTLEMAGRIRAAGMGFLLDIHYSDTWADPGRQEIPAAWKGLPFPALRDSVYRYTFGVMTALKDADAVPEMVQIGNEITCGMLWDAGRVCGGFDTPGQWDHLAALLEDAARGIADALSPADTVRIMVHIDRGGDGAGAVRFLDRLARRGVRFDVIGLSYYPWWHGTLGDLGAALDTLAARYDRDIVVVEAAYPWTLDWKDGTHNSVGLAGQLLDGYPATVAGQQAFYSDLLGLVAGARSNRGAGVFLWEPGWISTPEAGSPGENLTLFDFSGALLGSIAAFERGPSGANRETHSSAPRPDRMTPPRPDHPDTAAGRSH